MKQAVKIKKRIGVRGKLMLSMCAISALLLAVVWAAIVWLLQPAYNRFMQNRLQDNLTALCTRFDEAAADGVEISSRTLFTTYMDSNFWDGINNDIENGDIRTDDICIDISDSTLMSLSYVENVPDCLLHDQSASRFGILGESRNRDTPAVIDLRRQVFADGSLFTIYRNGAGASQMVVGQLTGGGEYAVLVSTDLARIDEAGRVLGFMMPFIALALFLASLATSWLLSRLITRPLTALSAAARQVAAGNYDVQVSEDGDDEMSLLAKDFNYMASRVKQSEVLQRELLANVSHDLRTPLALIKGYAETVRDITGDDAAHRTDQMNIIIDEADRLSGLVNSVMEYSKVSTGTEKPEMVRFDMADLCDEVAERYRENALRTGWNIETQLQPAMVTADPGMMERVLHNLLGNATHHLGADGYFALRVLALPEGGCRVEVQDHGPGVKPEDLPHIFDRYYRSRSDSGKQGSGLGLSITKAIFQSHNFQYGVDSTLGVGTTFWFVMTDSGAPKALPAEGAQGGTKALPADGTKNS